MEWMKVDEAHKEAWLQALREEGVPEDKLEEEMEKLYANAQVSTNARAVLITPEMDEVLKRVFKFAINGGTIDEISVGEFERTVNGIWPQ